jgi:hypothetical protein
VFDIARTAINCDYSLFNIHLSGHMFTSLTFFGETDALKRLMGFIGLGPD